MSAPEPCYLVEWYRPAAAGGSLEWTAAVLEASAAVESSLGPTVTLISMIAVPTDEMLLGLFCAGSADVVSKVCERARLPADRLTAATDIRLSSGG